MAKISKIGFLENVGFVLIGVLALCATPAVKAAFTPIAAGATVSPVQTDALFPVGTTLADQLTAPWSDGVNSGDVFTQVYTGATFTDFYYFLNLNQGPAYLNSFVAGLNAQGFAGDTTSVAQSLPSTGLSSPDSAIRSADGSTISFTFEGSPGIDQGEYGGNLFSEILAVRVAGSYSLFAPITSTVQGGNGIANVQTLAIATAPDTGATLLLLALAAGPILLFYRGQMPRTEFRGAN